MKTTTPQTNNISIFDRAETIDAVINSKLDQMPQKGGKCNSKTGAWLPHEIELRNAVIMQYIAEQGLSKDRTAHQISNRWHITYGTAKNWVTKAIADFSSSYAEENQEENRKLWLERCEQILQDAIETKDKANALKALDLMGKSMGIYQEKKDIDLNGKTTITFDFQ